MRKGDIIELKIDRVAHGGPGVARVDGFVVFVKGGVPGDTVKALLTKKKKDFAEARAIEVVDPSSDRVDPPCPYFGYCGGCQWQHVRYTRQLEYKRALVEEAMARIGGLSGIPIHDPIGSEKIFGYRNKMEFSFSDRPWVIHDPPPLCPLPPPSPGSSTGEGKQGWDDQLALGLHVPGSFHKVLDIDACLLQEDRGNEILQAVKEFAGESGLAPYNLKTHEGFWRFLTLRRSVFYKVWMVNVITSEYRKDVVESLARFLTSTFPDVKTVVNNITARRAAVAVGEWESVLTGTGVIEDRIGPYAFQVSANSFFQTNTPGAATLYNTVLEYAELTGSENVLDLYSGTGTIPIFLSARSKLVIGMEISESALEDAGKNCRTNSIQNCRFILGDIRTGLSSLAFQPDVLIIDPPRAGMHKDVVAKTMDLATEKIVYVSCNPATMARDLAEMKDSYEVVEIQPVDMFPHTYHVESVAKLIRRSN
jgi:23S rRNA (uracil1939-C5)-methyltransferase